MQKTEDATATAGKPDRSAFSSQRAITSVLAHEAVHATGAQQRLAREFGRRFVDRAYAVED